LANDSIATLGTTSNARLDVLEVDAAKRRLERLDDGYHLLRRVRGDLEVEHIDVGKALEKYGFALHHGFERVGPHITQAEHRRAVAHDRNQVAPVGVVEDGVLVFVDAAARLGHPGTVGQGHAVAIGFVARISSFPGRGPRA
jgi:hypothetical protein